MSHSNVMIAEAPYICVGFEQLEIEESWTPLNPPNKAAYCDFQNQSGTILWISDYEDIGSGHILREGKHILYIGDLLKLRFYGPGTLSVSYYKAIG